LDDWYVTGLIDGVGSFTFSRSGKQLAVYFAVKVSGSPAVLEELQAFFGGGVIYTSGRSSYFRIQRRDDLTAVLDHFDRFPLRTKRATYEIWREMVIAKRAFRKPDRDRLESLAAELSSLSR
jgi:hypothetical protein